mmetsp:Transcript_15232/g.20794  ORF Transcript_15232/g.20794 Transcript_15232/m.20794 type:complete len:144 (+) Transcript_15232:309-740(+)
METEEGLKMELVMILDVIKVTTNWYRTRSYRFQPEEEFTKCLIQRGNCQAPPPPKYASSDLSFCHTLKYKEYSLSWRQSDGAAAHSSWHQLSLHTDIACKSNVRMGSFLTSLLRSGKFVKSCLQQGHGVPSCILISQSTIHSE